MTVRDVLLDADQEARHQAIRLEVGLYKPKLPSGFVERHYWLNAIEERELRRLKTAAAAATDAATLVALAKGRAVNTSRLNPAMISYWRRNA